MRLKLAMPISFGNVCHLFCGARRSCVRLRFLLPALALLVAVRGHAANGLTGYYYDTATFSALKTNRTDATVNFDWGTSVPAGTALTSADTFSVAWAGQLEPEFSQLYTFYVTADDGARVWVNDQLVVARTTSAASQEMRGQALLKAGAKVNIRLEYVEQAGSAKVRLEWSCASRAREVIPAERLFTVRVEKAGGSLLREHWSAVSGGAITSLTASVNYPNKPSGREFITSFECLAQDWTNAYGTRVTGYIVPPESGSYTFAVSGDDVASLYLSTDATTNSKALIASVTNATGFRVWDAQPSQQSAPRALVQGQRYYVELLHKENTGSDHWSVGWMKPGDAAFSVIPGTALVQPGLTAAQPAEASLFNTLVQEHPRLFATAERFEKLRAAWQSAAASQPKTWAQSAISGANAILTQDPVAYSQDVRGTILDQSRTAKDRLYKLGVAWQLTGDSQYAERAWEELSTVAAFSDWHPAHFLDTAEMTHACAIGYDWLYPYWTQARRDTIRGAIITNGLSAGLSQYTSNAGWSQSTGNNWNMVCNGGLSMGALAVGIESEALAENILNRALNSTRPVWRHFTTDGGAWYEGPGYFGYTTEYGVRMLAALEWTLGSDFGISSTTNLSESGFAPAHATGPSGLMFNFADASAGGALRGPIFQWFARRYNQPLFTWWENQGTGGALDALWWDDNAASLTDLGAQPDMAFHGDAGTDFQPQEMVTMRSNWSNVRATYVGSKGGLMGADHGNLDAGTFVLDALGKRWFHDLGGDDYALPGYFSSAPSAGTDRWDYYRMRPEGQNTLTISPSANADMVLGAFAPLVAYQSEPGGSSSFAIHDLTAVYSGMTRVWRGTRLLGARDEVLIQDEIQASTGKTVWWFAHFTYPATTVVLAPDNTSALMTQGAERLWCKIVSGGGTFLITNAVPLPTSPVLTNQNANAGYKKLAIKLSNVTNTTLAVWFVPLNSGDSVPTVLPTLSALNTWGLAAVNDAPVAMNGGATGSGDGVVDIDLRGYVTDDATPPELMRFSVSNGAYGSVVLLADGHTARFTPAPGTTGTPMFGFTASDTGPDPRVLLAYDFELPDASATNTVPDASGLGRDGTLSAIGTGRATLQADVAAAFGRDGRSIDLAENGGANAARLSRVVATNELNFNTSNWTITGWFKRRDNASDDMIWHMNSGRGYGTGEELYLMMSGDSSLTLSHYPGPDVSIVTNGVATNVWHHFAVVRNASKMSLYLNGSLAGEDTSFALAINQTNAFIFGGHTDASATYAPRWFDGKLDELAVYGAALSPAEVGTLSDGMTVRHFGGLSATGTITLSTAPTAYVWTNASAGAALQWSTIANWAGNAAPVSSRGAAIQYFTGQTLAGGSITSRNDSASDFSLNNLILSGTASTAATVSITGGALTLLDNGITAPTVTLNAIAGAGLTYDVATPITLAADTTFGGAGSASLRVSGAIDGAGAINKTSSGTLTLTGLNTYSGDTLISAGTLQVGADGAGGSLGSGDVVDNGQLRFDRTGTLAVSNAISGSGSVYIDCPINTGTVVLSGTNTFTGSVTVNSGALRITSSGALGSGTKTIALNNGSAGAPQLRLDGSAAPIELPSSITYRTSSNSGALINEAGTNTLDGDITLTSGGGDTKILVSAGSLTLNGSLAPDAPSRTLQLSGTGIGMITGPITNSGPNLLNVAKNDAGTWLLGGTNTYTGTTTISAGTLMLGSASALGRGGPNLGNNSGGCSVIAGATLDLSGQAGVNEVITLRGSGLGGIGALVNSSAAPASIDGGVLSAVAVTAGGTHSTVPNVTFSGPGSGAAAVATLGLSAASFTIDPGTAVYSSAPSVTISGGGGSGAGATAALTNGVVSGITMASAGVGYSSPPAIAFSGGTVTSAGVYPSGTGNASSFTVSGITVTDSGSGYTAVPTVSFGSGTGTAANAYLSSVALGANTLVGGAGDVVVDAPISGGYALTKIGAGSLTLAAVTNTYTGPTIVSNGTLVLCHNVTSTLTAATGTLAPSGTPSTSGNVAIGSGGRFAARINGTVVGTEYDQLTVGGSVTLAGALDIQAGPDLPLGSTYTIINNVAAGAVSGTFTNKPNNSTFTAGGYNWRIAYNGGSGNDVVLWLFAPPTVSDVTNVTILANTSTEAIPVTVGDVETPAASLSLIGASSNVTLVPHTNIVFGGSGANRTVTVTPASNQVGAATITLTVSDGTDTTTDTFLLNVITLAVWTNAATGTPLPWTQGANWLSGAPAVSSTNGTVEFLAGQTLAEGTVISTNNNAGTFQLSTLRLAGTGPASGAAAVALVGNGLSFIGGAGSPVLRLDADAGAGGLAYSVANAVTLTKATSVVGSGTAAFALAGIIQGAGGLAKSGTATLALSGANTYSGGTTLSGDAGTVRVTVSSAQSGLGAGPVEIGPAAVLQLDNVNAAAGTVTKTNTFTGLGKLRFNFATNATARSTSLPGLTGFAGTIQLTNAVASGDKWDASGVSAPGAAVQIDNGNTLVLTRSSASFGTIAVRGLGNAEGRGAICLVTNTATLAGAVSLLGDATIAGDAAGATLSGPIVGTAVIGATQTLTQGSAAALAGCTISGAISDGANGGRVALVQTKGTLTLSGLNTYSGATTVSGGTLQIGALNTLSTANSVTLGTVSGAGSLALNAFSQTLASLTAASTNSVLTNVVTIAAGQTLTVSGTNGLTVGIDSGANSVTRARMSGGGSLVVTNAAAMVTVGKPQASQNYSNSGTLELAGLSSVTLGSAAVPVSELRVGFGQTSTGWLTLSDTNNTITVTTLQIGNSNTNNGGTGTIILGAGTNVIAANTVNIGLSKSSGTLKFASQIAGSPGTVTIGGRTRASADLVVGAKASTGTSATPVGTLDLRGHIATVSAGALTLAKEDNSSTMYNGGTTGLLLFDGGIFTVSNVTMAAKSAAGAGSAIATLTVSGGVFTVTSGGSFSLASQTGAGAASGTLNVNGGTLRCGADIRDGGGNATSTVSLAGGTLDMTGRAIGSSSQRVDMVTLRSGSLLNLGQLNNGAPLVKTGGGTLSLAGTNTYTGATVVSNGTLRLTWPLCLPPSNTVYLVTGATNQLDYAGTQTVHALYINGKPKSAGVYGQDNLSPYLSGAGFLKVEWPPSSRTVFLLQ
jgi:autotransporter-associated beta strand protein